MKADAIRHIKKMILLLAGSVVLGVILLVLSFCIPTGRMKVNVAKSVGQLVLTEEEAPEDAFQYYLWAERETYTDCIMAQNAIEKIEGKNVFEHAMWMYHSDLDPEIWTPEESIKVYCSREDNSQMYLHQYSRYWHGYLVYLKPLLLVLSWEQIVTLGGILVLALLAAVIVCAVRRKQLGAAVCMLAGAVFMKPVLMCSSLSMNVCCVIALSAVLYILLKYDKLEKRGDFPEVFLMLGIMTSYFDFLTYPVITLGFPMAVCFLMKEKETVKRDIGRIILYSLCWGIGYAGMWASKWVVADITLQTGTIKNALWSIIGWTDSIGGRPRMNGGGYVIGLNLQEYESIWYLAAAAVLGAAVIALLAAAAYRTSIKEVLAMAVPYAAIFCIPFAWLVVIQSHSALHARFTFRIIGVAAAAAVCMGICAVRMLRKKASSLCS